MEKASHWNKGGTRQNRCYLKRGYIDLVPLNCFYVDGKFLFYDQESYVESLPAKVILLRTIDLIYMGNPQLYKVLPIEDVKERYGLIECQEMFYSFVGKFLDELRNDHLLRFYHKQVRRDSGIINANRQRMNYSAGDYERIFRDIFQGQRTGNCICLALGILQNNFCHSFTENIRLQESLIMIQRSGGCSLMVYQYIRLLI